MKEQQMFVWQEPPAIRLLPIISYPRVAEAGKQYLLSIDVRLADETPWPYTAEEFEISFALDTAPFFLHEPIGEQTPGLILHRFGGTYGPAEYLLTASKQTQPPGTIKLTLLNGWGLPIARLELECEVKKAVSPPTKVKTIRSIKAGRPSIPGLPPLAAAQAAPPPQEDQHALIARQLSRAGWDVQFVGHFTEEEIFHRIPGLGRLALQGPPSLENDFVLVIDRVLVGIVKVIPEEEEAHIDDLVEGITFPDITKSTNLTLKESRNTAEQLQSNVPFMYYTTGYATVFHNYFESGHARRIVYTFHQAAMLATWHRWATNTAQGEPFRVRLQHMPPLEQGNLFDYQFEALQRIERSLSNYRVHTLVQMETGSGKTHTALRSIYRLLSDANAQHILYLVDTSPNAQYALDSFRRFALPDRDQKFTDRYQVRLIANEKLDPSVHVYIGTLDALSRLYASNKAGEGLPPPGTNNSSRRVVDFSKSYCPDLPIEYFDAIFLPECEHIPYQVWAPVLDYFDAFFIGIASRLSEEVVRFFENNVVHSAQEDSETAQDTASFSPRQKQVSDTLRVVRNLLRNDAGLTYETDRASQLVWLLFLKNLDDFELAQEELLGNDYHPIIAEPYRWRDWAGTESVDRRQGDELLNFVNDHLFPHLSQLRGEDERDLRTIIGTIFQNTSNRISSGFILSEAAYKLNTINFNMSEDLQATSLFYVTLLKEMHGSSREAGGFYTPRPLVRFIIDRLQPRLGEHTLDPACGTAGFLVEAYERLASQVRTPEQRRQLQDRLIGIEKKPVPYLLAIMNMLVHGIESPHVLLRNALTTDIQQLQDEDFVDIIATNPPFSGEEERSVMHNLSEGQYLRTTRTPLLFIQYILQTLKRPSGRCGIVSPNGFLFWSGVASDMRRRLLTHFNLHTIVRLPPGVFAPSTSIPTNILFFEAGEALSYPEENPCTKEVWYYEIPLPEGRSSFSKTKPIQDEDFRDCLNWWNQRAENEHAWRVPVQQLLANDCNLNSENPRRPKTTTPPAHERTAPLEESQPAHNTEEVTIERADKHRFVIGDVISYELDANGKQLRTGTPSQFAQEALKDMIRTPEDLRKYWLGPQERALLIDLTHQVVALDALASSLDLPEVDYYDLLLYVLFQQPPITRAERVARLRATHNAFFQRFAHNPLAKELLDVILEKYIQGDAPDVSDMALLGVPPLNARRPIEWAQIFSQGTPKANLSTTLKELQQLLYSV